jgi:uncharacterized protein (DUF885 family)
MTKTHIFWVSLLLIFNLTWGQDLGERYIGEWKKFYPSKAAKSGMHASIFAYENREEKSIQKWVQFNKEFLSEVSKEDVPIDPIDARLLRVQAQSEIDLYESLAKHQRSLRLYSRLISNAIPSVLNANYLLKPEQSDLFCDRLKAIATLAKAAQDNLVDAPKNDLENALNDVKKTLGRLRNDHDETSKILNLATCGNDQVIEAIQALEALHVFADGLLQKAKEQNTMLGRTEYDRQLQLYTDSELTSKKLEEMALTEIKAVKSLMVEVSKNYLKVTYPDTPRPAHDLEIIQRALGDMEKDAPLNSFDYLQFWERLTDLAVTFIKENDIATLPRTNTLRIQTAPESAGPAARIGWVASAPPFDPNPMTVLNLPSIPETLPEQEQIDFWASFNKPFNRMIVIHELYPGHYMQLKISRETAHPVRLLYPYGIYIEGWATFTEKVLLDAGWQKGNHLTLLAHLRKRLENANRSYTSVKVHCDGWNKEQVLKFSTETSLLAPQFAKSLWGRIMNSPMQLTSYFLGGAQFTELFNHEKKRLGPKFNLKLFMDTVMKAGPIPIDEFYQIFEQTQQTD